MVKGVTSNAQQCRLKPAPTNYNIWGHVRNAAMPSPTHPTIYREPPKLHKNVVPFSLSKGERSSCLRSNAGKQSSFPTEFGSFVKRRNAMHLAPNNQRPLDPRRNAVNQTPRKHKEGKNNG